MKTQEIPEDEFRLGITMAGAVSAGCYTGGVMDYLIELLDLWERAKLAKGAKMKGQQNLYGLDDFKDYFHLVPEHKVIIEALGGASAGGMTTTMSAIYLLNGKINPVTSSSFVNRKKGNLLYDSWVLMDDSERNPKKTTFSKLWENNDLRERGLTSLLNSDFVDRIADHAFDLSQSNDKKGSLTLTQQVKKLPGYVSKDLQMILSHTLLRGIPLGVDFITPIATQGKKSANPHHTSFEHYFVSHFHMNKGIVPNNSQYFFLNPYDLESARILKLCTVATGAFPVGLRFREFDEKFLNGDYLKTIYRRIISGHFGLADPPIEDIDLRHLPKDFWSLTMDGGAINNEPYREVQSILSDQYGEPNEGKSPSYGVVMIDPFPDMATNLESYAKANDVLDVVPEILGALADQSRVKRREMLENTSGKYFTGMIFPRRWEDVNGKFQPEKFPLISASVEAFGGFLDVRFRHYDFFLGRDNARNFFRYFFSLLYDPEKGIIHAIHKNWTPEMVSIFKMIGKDGKTYLPIVPDLYLILEEHKKIPKKGWNSYSIKGKPTFDPKPLFKSQKVIQRRLIGIFRLVKEKKYISKNERSSHITKRYMSQYYRRGIFGWFSSIISPVLLNLSYFIFKRSVAKGLTKKIINFVLADLEHRGLLK